MVACYEEDHKNLILLKDTEPFLSVENWHFGTESLPSIGLNQCYFSDGIFLFSINNFLLHYLKLQTPIFTDFSGFV